MLNPLYQSIRYFYYRKKMQYWLFKQRQIRLSMHNLDSPENLIALMEQFRVQHRLNDGEIAIIVRTLYDAFLQTRAPYPWVMSWFKPLLNYYSPQKILAFIFSATGYDAILQLNDAELEIGLVNLILDKKLYLYQ